MDIPRCFQRSKIVNIWRSMAHACVRYGERQLKCHFKHNFSIDLICQDYLYLTVSNVYCWTTLTHPFSLRSWVLRLFHFHPFTGISTYVPWPKRNLKIEIRKVKRRYELGVKYEEENCNTRHMFPTTANQKKGGGQPTRYHNLLKFRQNRTWRTERTLCDESKV